MPNTYSWEVHDLIVDPVEGALADVVKKIDCYLVANDSHIDERCSTTG